MAGCVCIGPMKITMLAILGGVLLLAAGCIHTVDGGRTAAWPSGRDKVENRYERSVEQAYQAATEVIKASGVLTSESTLFNQTNATKTVVGKVAQRDVWVRVEALNPQITSVQVQARSQGGVADIAIAHQVATEIGVKLATR